MAYLVHIVRQNDYSNPEEASNISLDEWLDYVNSDPELEPASGYQLNLPVLLNPEDIIPIDQDPGCCDWLGHPRADVDTIPVFNFSRGSITTKYPDNHTIGKMIQVALALNAKVKGDDDEYYDETFFSNGGNPVQ